MKFSSAMLALFLAVTILIISLVLSERNNQPAIVVTEHWLADFIADKQNLHQVQIYNRNNELLINAQLIKDNWVVTNLDNYPLKMSQFSQWLEQLILAKNIEEKTNRPEQFYKLGLQDPSASEETLKQALKNSVKSVRALESDRDNYAYLVKLNTGKQFDLLIGKQAANGNGQFVRRQRSQKTWLLNYNIEMPKTSSDWIKTDFFNWNIQQVNRVSIQHVDLQEEFKIERVDIALANHSQAEPELNKQPTKMGDVWAMSPLKPEQQIGAEKTITNYINQLSNLSFVEPEAVNPELWQQDSIVLIQIAFNDDSLVSLSLRSNDEQHWVRVMAQGSGQIATELAGLTQWQFKLSSTQFKQINQRLSYFLANPVTE
ncbi:DUF4340 domain-containing protein [Catenovulum sp. 2E275]|uniref:DUF4340 domain-containing protein n=1 Tax=Catenovulum sp. 2E275 TaxID=2980497 RepID=UPI0021D08DE3|nr:DUF4340 domain-containing protein [Catenovulum sp. 2E275]MCU4676811.1 DUF4340 domain-containing protein [Catenovulum sp. 2E275]